MPETPISETPTFEAAIELSQAFITQLEQGSLSESQQQQTLAQLVQSENGARGFFVTYLTDDRPLADQPADAIVAGLRSSPEIVAELLVKNVAMSAAMATVHRQQNREAMAQKSERVRDRSLHLIQRLNLPEVQQKAAQLHESTITGTGSYASFLDRWGYDANQRQIIQAAIAPVAAVQEA